MIKFFWFLIFIFSFSIMKGQEAISEAKLKAAYYSKQSEDFYKKGDNEKHKLYSDSLLFISKQYKLHNMELNAMMNQGVYYRNVNQLKKALNTYLKILEKAKTVPNSEKNTIMTMVNMGNIYNTIQKPNKAISVFNEALPLIKKYPNNSYITAATYAGLGKANSILGHIDVSLKYHYKLKHLADSLQNTYLQVTAFTDISDLLNLKRDHLNGLKVAKEALELNSSYSDSILQKDLILLNIGISFKGLKKIDSAKTYFDKAKETAITKNNDAIEMEVEKHLAEIYEQLNDFKAAQKSQKRYSELSRNNLNEQNEAIVLDIEKEAEQKIEDVNKSNTSLLILTWVTLFIVFGGILIFFKKRKNKIARQNIQLQKDYKWLQSQYASLKENLKQLSVERTNTENYSEKYKNSSLNKQDREEIVNRILEFMEQEKPFLDLDLTQTEFSKKIKIPSHHLSEVLTLSFKQNFQNFINLYRIDTAQKLLLNPEYKNYKIEAIAYDSGFNSKTSFNRVFKNITGKTPSEYRKSH